MKWSTRSVEIQNGMAAFLVGLLLMYPAKTFASGPGYRVFLESGIPEFGWGAVFMVLGGLQVTGSLTGPVVLRRLAASLLACLFGVYVIGFAIANPVSAAIPFVLPMVVGQVVAFFVARRDV
jgi:hypothetical protein